uniref:Uncharacterized protein n=1 Tax=Ditylenchus dipsaci TaxID=166011 RepID=A0A915DPL4_9BILA
MQIKSTVWKKSNRMDSQLIARHLIVDHMFLEKVSNLVECIKQVFLEAKAGCKFVLSLKLYFDLEQFTITNQETNEVLKLFSVMNGVPDYAEQIYRITRHTTDHLTQMEEEYSAAGSNFYRVKFFYYYS